MVVCLAAGVVDQGEKHRCLTRQDDVLLLARVAPRSSVALRPVNGLDDLVPGVVGRGERLRRLACQDDGVVLTQGSPMIIGGSLCASALQVVHSEYCQEREEMLPAWCRVSVLSLVRRQRRRWMRRRRPEATALRGESTVTHPARAPHHQPLHHELSFSRRSSASSCQAPRCKCCG